MISAVDSIRFLARDWRHEGSGRVRPDAEHLSVTMAWLEGAHDACQGGGVSAGFHLLRGWAAAYPETTGYLIPTFLRHARFGRQPESRRRALAMADWELAQQLPSGAIPGRTGRKAEPVVFDTGQVIFGWVSAYRSQRDPRYLAAAERAADWLVAVQESDGAWRRHEFRGIAHAYNSRVSWALLALGEELANPAYAECAIRQLEWTLSGQDADGWIGQMAFESGAAAFVHTIAYTLEGLWESAGYVPEELAGRIRASVLHAWEGLTASLAETPMTGSFRQGWQPAGHFYCLTGHAQLALIAMRISQVTQDARYRQQAEEFLVPVKRSQPTAGYRPGIRGGIAGSRPMLGRYLPGWFPNWAAKFFADALMLNLELEAGGQGNWDAGVG